MRSIVPQLSGGMRFIVRADEKLTTFLERNWRFAKTVLTLLSMLEISRSRKVR